MIAREDMLNGVAFFSGRRVTVVTPFDDFPAASREQAQAVIDEAHAAVTPTLQTAAEVLVCKVVRDACVSHFLHRDLEKYHVTTIAYARFATLLERDLLGAVEAEFGVLVAQDCHLADLNRLAQYDVGIGLVVAHPQTLPTYRRLLSGVRDAVREL